MMKQITIVLFAAMLTGCVPTDNIHKPGKGSERMTITFQTEGDRFVVERYESGKWVQDTAIAGGSGIIMIAKKSNQYRFVAVKDAKKDYSKVYYIKN